MFRKILVGSLLFFMALFLAVGLLTVTSLTAAGVAIASVVDNFDNSTVQVTDESGNTETYRVGELLSESNRVEIIGDNGEQVTIDLNLPQVSVQDNGGEVSRVVIGGESGVVISEGSQIRIDGRNVDNFDNFDGGFIGRIIGGFFQAMFTLAFWGLVVVGIIMVLRNRRPAVTEKTPDAVV